MPAESHDRWHQKFFLWTILSWDDPQNFSHWSDVAFYICNYDVITKAPMTIKKSLFHMTSTCQVSILSLGVVSEIEVQSFSVFPTWLSHYVAYDVIIMIKTFYMNIRSSGENFVSIWQLVAEKNTKVLCGQTNKQTDPNAIPSPSSRIIRMIPMTPSVKNVKLEQVQKLPK